MKKLISIISPAFNEEGCVDELAKRIRSVFAKENENLEIIGGLDDTGKVLSREDVMTLAKLPSREVLTAQVVGTIAAPLSGFVRVLNGNITQFMYALNAIQDKKGEA